MSVGTRSNQGYEIIEGCTIGNEEIVIGHHPKAPNPYVCWYCMGGDNYYQGCYCNTIQAAREELIERYQSECQMPYNQPLKKERCITMDNKNRKINNHRVVHSIHIGRKEVVFGIDEKDTYPFLVCDCTYDNPLSAAFVNSAFCSEDYLEAMQTFIDRVQEQIMAVKAEHGQFQFDMTPFTIDDCIPDDRGKSIVGRVVVIKAEVNRYEYRHSAYQLVLATGGNGAKGGRGQAVFGTCLADGRRARWERHDVLGEIRPEKMPDWAKEALVQIQEQENTEK